MSGLAKIIETDGTYSILAAGRVLRGSLTTDEADDLMRSLRSMEPDEGSEDFNG